MHLAELKENRARQEEAVRASAAKQLVGQRKELTKVLDVSVKELAAVAKKKDLLERHLELAPGAKQRLTGKGEDLAKLPAGESTPSLTCV